MKRRKLKHYLFSILMYLGISKKFGFLNTKKALKGIKIILEMINPKRKKIRKIIIL